MLGRITTSFNLVITYFILTAILILKVVANEIPTCKPPYSDELTPVKFLPGESPPENSPANSSRLVPPFLTNHKYSKDSDTNVRQIICNYS